MNCPYLGLFEQLLSGDPNKPANGEFSLGKENRHLLHLNYHLNRSPRCQIENRDTVEMIRTWMKQRKDLKDMSSRTDRIRYATEHGELAKVKLNELIKYIESEISNYVNNANYEVTSF